MGKLLWFQGSFPVGRKEVRIAITTGIEADEMLAELSQLIGSSPQSIATIILNSQLQSMYTAKMVNAERDKKFSTERMKDDLAKDFFRTNRTDKVFQKWLKDRLENEPMFVPIEDNTYKTPYDILMEYPPFAATQQPQGEADSQVSNPLLEPEQDLAKLDEESRWDWKSRNFSSNYSMGIKPDEYRQEHMQHQRPIRERITKEEL